MDKDLFDGLVKGIKEAGKVKRGEKRPSRVFIYSPLDVKALREKLGFTQADFSRLALVGAITPSVARSERIEHGSASEEKGFKGR